MTESSQTPGYNEDLLSYLFGNILMVSSTDRWLMLILDVGLLAVVSCAGANSSPSASTRSSPA